MHCRLHAAFRFYAALLLPMLGFANFHYSIFFSNDNFGAQLTWIDVNGKIWELPMNKTDDVEVFTNHPREVVGFDGAKIIALAYGGDHRLVLDNEGRVWAWGENSFGQLGLGDVQKRTEPTLIPSLKNIAVIKSGNSTSCALDQQGRLFRFGYIYQPSSVLGRVLIPTPIEGLPEIKDFAIGTDHMLALDIYGNVWSFGANQFGQSGIGFTETGLAVPTKLSEIPLIRRVKATHSRSFLVDNQAQVWIFGESAEKALDPGNWGGLSRPTLIHNWRFKEIAAFESGIAAITLENSLRIWEIESGEKQLKTHLIPTAIATGQNSVIILDNEGRIHFYKQSFGEQPVEITQIPVGTFQRPVRQVKSARKSAMQSLEI